ncbi:hypothetical protein JOF28_000107 [Leucobacter exalbidus]|uniref:Uncharacterized protein n=1 Tax=Leucobacter exalbidus TaxID=662960 RepID=A0A940PRG1_9MICO|nr:hypothetical protein [Leucobacter exalbidus]MBP1324875.1 hypothetical protein [Leucobacter exalbidus]
MNQNTHLRLAASVVTGGLALLALTGCAFIEDIQKTSADAWAVTYEVSTDTEAATPLQQVTYLDQETRAVEVAPVTLDEALAQPTAAEDTASWQTDTLALTGAKVSVSATPPATVTAHCRILLDGEREIAAETGGPGEEVTCEAVTPPFDK